MFDESKHPRDNGGKFTDKSGGSRDSYAQSVNDRIKWAKENGVDLPLNNDGSVDDLKLQELVSEKKQAVLRDLLGKEFTGYKGQSAVDKLMQEKQGHIKGAFHRDDIGDIDLLWGNDYIGLQHIISHREEQGINASEFLQDLANVVEKGEFLKQNKRGNFELQYGRKVAVIAPEFKGERVNYVLTAYKTREKKKPPQ